MSCYGESKIRSVDFKLENNIFSSFMSSGGRHLMSVLIIQGDEVSNLCKNVSEIRLIEVR